MKSDKTAIILGATGLTGNMLLHKLLTDNRYKKIIIFSRRSTKIKHPKLEEHLVDLFELEKYKDQFNANEVFCCVGTTKKKTPDDQTYKKVDYGIPLTAAKLAKANHIHTYIVISALGADTKSRFFYNKVKGQMEEAVLQQNIKHTYILRPSLIAGKRKEKRPFEFVWKQLMKVGNFLMVGPLKKYRSIHPKTIVKAMIFLANNSCKKTYISSEEIKQLVRYERD